jgi:hypothetical protein
VGLQPRTENLQDPGFNPMKGVTEQVLPSEAHPSSSTVYDFCILTPVGSMTRRLYLVAPTEGFQTYVGVVSPILPKGEINRGAGGAAIVKSIGSLQGPSPAGFDVCTHHRPIPAAS